jgi:hypothetical protein
MDPATFSCQFIIDMELPYTARKAIIQIWSAAACVRLCFHNAVIGKLLKAAASRRISKGKPLFSSI